MVQDKRKYEKRTYKTADGKDVDYTVYFMEGRGTPAIEEGEILRLALEAGCKEIVVSKPIQVVEDNMFYMGKQKDTFGSKELKYGKDEGKPNPQYTPRSCRYVAYAQCTGPDGTVYEDLGSAAPDNVEMLKCYMPEMAIKRARVRALILALGLKGLNADVEFADGDNNAAAEMLEQKAERMKKIQDVFTEMGLKKTAADGEKKRNLITQCFGKYIPHNKLTVEQLDKFILFLTTVNKKDDDG